jgi:16S rRNA (cytidine1402-2'-O)-methyltransferase
MSVLYIVSTPIGHLEDVSFRAVAVLKDVDRVLAEDTRRTAILFRRYGISTPLFSAHEHNEAARAAQLLQWLDAGQTVALVSDAGTPLLSDPGERLVRAVVDGGHEAVPVPGASALLAALVLSGVAAEPFTFYGFLPRGGAARRERLAEIGTLRHTAVLYEAPARLAALLQDLSAVSTGIRPVAVARELTKLHETIVRGTLDEVHAHFAGATVRGEIVVVVGAAPPDVPTEEDAATLAAALLAAGETPKSAARELADRLGIPRNDAYALVLSLREGGAGKD